MSLEYCVENIYSSKNTNKVRVILVKLRGGLSEINTILSFNSVIESLSNSINQIEKVLGGEMEEYIIQPTEDIPYMAIIVNKDFVWATEDPKHKLETKEFSQFLKFANEKYIEFEKLNKN
jgi:hypothetical protein